jgi:hypothetical protein
MNVKVNVNVCMVINYITGDGVKMHVCTTLNNQYSGLTPFINWLIEKGYKIQDIEIKEA